MAETKPPVPFRPTSRATNAPGTETPAGCSAPFHNLLSSGPSNSSFHRSVPPVPHAGSLRASGRASGGAASGFWSGLASRRDPSVSPVPASGCSVEVPPDPENAPHPKAMAEGTQANKSAEIVRFIAASVTARHGVVFLERAGTNQSRSRWLPCSSSKGTARATLDPLLGRFSPKNPGLGGQASARRRHDA